MRKKDKINGVLLSLSSVSPMIFQSIIRIKLVVYLCILLIISSCSKDTEDIKHTYLVHYDKMYTLQNSFILSILNEISSDQPEVIELINNVNYNVEVYNITYKTRYKDEDIIASGLVCIPHSSIDFPIISFQNGTNTSHINAPTTNWSNPMFMLLQSLASNGYIILIPDYIGFGESENKMHPYYVKSTTNSAIIDMIYAVQELLEYYSTGANYNDEYFLMGYSQGGWATLAALEELEINHASNIEVRATSCGAGAYNLMHVSDYILQQNTFPSPLYLPYYMYSHQQYGSINDSLDKYFQEPYLSRIPELFSGNHNNSYINSQLTDTVAGLLATEFITGFSDSPVYEELRSDLVLNSVNAWPASSLVHLYHGTEDLNVPISESQNMYSDFMALDLGNRVKLIELEGKNHESGILPWGIKTFIWFNKIKVNE